MTTAQDAAETLERAIARLSVNKTAIMHAALEQLGPQGRWDLYNNLANELDQVFEDRFDRERRPW